MVHHQPVMLTNRQVDGYVISLGAVNLVFAKTETGLAGCGAFDVAALEKFGYPAVKIAGSQGKPIAAIADLLAGTVKEANAPAQARGVTAGMGCREALEKL